MQVTSVTSKNQSPSFGGYIKTGYAEQQIQSVISKMPKNSLVRKRFEALTDYFSSTKDRILYVATDNSSTEGAGLVAELYDGNFTSKPITVVAQKSKETVQKFINEVYKKFIPKK